MDRGAWQAAVHGVARVRHNLVTKPPPPEYIMRNSGLDEAQDGIKTAGEISVTSDMQMIPPLWHKVKNN